jgi:hypothetical protein
MSYATVAGAASSMVGSYFSAKSAKLQYQSEADLADINARIAERGAQSQLAAGQQQVGAVSLRAGMLKSSQRASMAANGIDLGTGNAAEVQASTDLMKEVDMNTVEANAVRAAWGYRTQSVNMQNEAIMKRASASGISPIGSAAISLIGSSGAVAQSWYQYKNRASASDTPAKGQSSSLGDYPSSNVG